MNLFEKVLKIKTSKEYIQVKAIYLENSTKSWNGAYYIYYYDSLNHTFYINDLDSSSYSDRLSAIDIIEHIFTKVYTQEMAISYIWALNKQQGEKPKLFCLYQQKLTNEIIIDKVKLESIVNENWEVVKYMTPKKANLEDTLKSLGLK